MNVYYQEVILITIQVIRGYNLGWCSLRFINREELKSVILLQSRLYEYNLRIAIEVSPFNLIL